MRSYSPDDLVLSAMTVAELHFGADAARHHAEIRYALRSQPIGERDLVIAATARAGVFVVVTGNRTEFERVPGLIVEGWGLGSG